MSRKNPTCDECCAFVLLARLFSLKGIYLSDKPDIKSNDGIGVEVTSALPEGEHRVESIYESLKNGNQICPEKMLSKGYRYRNGFAVHPILVEDDDFKTSSNDVSNKDMERLINSAILDKIDKKQKYEKCASFGLFIRTRLASSEISNLETICKNIYSLHSRDLDFIYFFIENENSVIYVNKDGNINAKSFDEDQLTYSKEAYNLWLKSQCN